MREQLNSNPLVQVAVIAVLLIGAAIFVLTSMGGGGEESDSSLSSSAAAGEGPAPSPVAGAPVPSEEEGSAPAEGSAIAPGTVLATQPLPHPVMAAWKADRTVALLFVHDGGIDDRLVRQSSARLDGMSEVSTFVVPADKIAEYASITEGVGVDRVPALVVLTPKRLDQSAPTASVSYGFRGGASVEQAVIDAGYEGPTLEYHP
jgi:hypothetical protein